MTTDLPRPAVLALSGPTGGTSPAGAAAWAAVIAMLATWPADQAVRPVIERRIGRASRTGRFTETVLLALHDPLGVLDERAATLELRELARPLLSAHALRELGPAATRRATGSVPAELRELPALSSVMPEGARALLPLLGSLYDGLEKLRGPVTFSLLVAPGNERRPAFDDDASSDEILRTVRFRVRVATDGPLPLALRSAAEAVCISERGALTPWAVATSEAERVAHRRSVERVELHPWSDVPDASVAASLASVMLALPGPSTGEVVGRSFGGTLSLDGPAIGKVQLANGRSGTWRVPWSLRRHHTFVAGASGSGKSSLLYRLAADDIARGRSVVLIDPHGDLGDLVGPLVSAQNLVRIDPRLPESYPLDLLDPDPARAAAHLASAVAEVWPSEFSGPVWQHAVGLALRVLAATRRERPLSLADVERFFTEPAWRDARIARVGSDSLRGEAERSSAAWARSGQDDSPLTNWVAGKLTPLVRGPGASLFKEGATETFEALLGGGKVILISLPVGLLGTEALRLTGRMLLSRLVTAIASQGNVPEHRRVPVSVLIDEAHAVAGGALEGLFAQARKFNTAVTVATQSPSQLGAHLGSVLTNTESMLLGRLPAIETQVLLDRVGVPTAQVLSTLPKFHAIPVDERHAPAERPVVLRPLGPPRTFPLGAPKAPRDRRPVIA